MRLFAECEYHQLNVTRLKACISEQCWAPRDIDGLTLTGSDKAVPYPEVVHQCLTNKLRNAKNRKKESSVIVGEKRRLLLEKHSQCHARGRAQINVLFKASTHEAKSKAAARREEIANEVKVLIRGSRW